MKEQRSVAFHTLGCKVNQYDTQVMIETLAKDYRIVSNEERADIYVINTCTVTNRADQKSRQQIRNVIRENRKALVAVTGCYAQRFPEAIARLPGVDLILGNQEKDEITILLNRVKKDSRPEVFVADINSSSRYGTWQVAQHQFHSRAFVKIQDGCENYCSYCIIPYVRGRSRSRPLKDTLEEIRKLVGNGYKEVVLTGIRLGSWGRDLHNSKNLATLLERVHEIEGLKRIRLSSLEPGDMNEHLIDRVIRLPKVCRHLHIPLQSGDDGILKLMNRPYDTRYYQDLIGRIRKKSEGLAITTDIMVGFPGEGEREFENTYNLARRIKFSRMHIFRYSPRPGTLIARLAGRGCAPESKQRSKRLLKLASKMQEEFGRSFLGRSLEVLVEKRRRNDYLTGFTDNYIRVIFNGPQGFKNRIVKVKITQVKRGSVIGMLAG